MATEDVRPNPEPDDLFAQLAGALILQRSRAILTSY